MENNSNPVIGDTASLTTLINAATWEVGLNIMPQADDCEPDARSLRIPAWTPATADDFEAFIRDRASAERAREEWAHVIDATIAAIDSLIQEEV